VDVLGKDPKTTVIVIDEVDTGNWGIGGETITSLRKGIGMVTPSIGNIAHQFYFLLLVRL
jgi:hypothetical protein